ncbi:hypothetical protein PR202_gb28846 [Eleusine coracana subsp. coracana]|uniref:RNase H type-1 domain-containing protein n=1 Tax=Eleusine coracana subsp. coracana TaxID=191504 RepID=A0AAV5FY08_ELECO|nr:hypothetical protein PR202_gb28846 [Eleusine coracana subsp. coracana]
MRSCYSVEEAEAEACLEGVRLTAEWVREPAIVEADCSTLIQSLVGTGQTREGWRGIRQEIQAASELLPECMFRKVSRNANRVAHALAKRAMSKGEFVVKRFGYPPCVGSLVLLETPTDCGDPSSSDTGQLHNDAVCNAAVTN